MEKRAPSTKSSGPCGEGTWEKDLLSALLAVYQQRHIYNQLHDLLLSNSNELLSMSNGFSDGQVNLKSDHKVLERSHRAKDTQCHLQYVSVK